MRMIKENISMADSSKAKKNTPPPPQPPIVPTQVWPDAYLTPPMGEPAFKPSWSPAECIEAGRQVAHRFTNEIVFAQKYLAIVQMHFVDPERQLLDRYKALIQATYEDGDYSNF